MSQSKITTASPMPFETLELLEWLEAVILELAMGHQEEVEGFSETDLINCLSMQEREQWNEIPGPIRRSMLAYVTEELVDRLSEEAYHRYHYGE